MNSLFETMRKYGTWPLVIVLVTTSFLTMVFTSLSDSGTMDELAHIPSGYSYVRYLDFRLNPEHPPLVKALAAFPLLFKNLNFPTEHRAWTDDINGQWDMGKEFLYYSGNDADSIIRWARLAPMLLTVLLILLIYVWSRERMGPFWALIPSFIFAFSPSVLAHGHYVTTDIAAALGILAGTYFFLKLLKNPSKKQLWIAGVVFGLAELLKFSAVLLVPFFVFLAIAWAWKDNRGRKFLKALLIPLRNTVLVFVIGYLLVVYPVYAFFTVNYPVARQASDTEYILLSFAEGPTEEGEACIPMRCLAELDIWMSGNKIFRPLAHYLLGVLMVIQRSAGGNTAYFLGEVSNGGSHFYFPAVYLLKEPLPVLFLVLSAFLASLAGILKTLRKKKLRVSETLRDYLGGHFSEFAMISFAVLYWGYSINSTLNIGFRHLFPAIPFMYILTAGAWKKWFFRVSGDMPHSLFSRLGFWLGQLFRASGKAILLSLLLLWFAFESAFAAPHFLSYFNQIGGTKYYGYRYVTDSNYDWGQDLLRFKKEVDARNEDGDPGNDIKKFAIDYFGAGNPKYYMGDSNVEYWSSSRGNPLDQGIEWFVVSINSIQGSIQPTPEWFVRNPADEFHWLTGSRASLPGFGNVPVPDFRAGTSLFVYKLSP